MTCDDQKCKGKQVDVMNCTDPERHGAPRFAPFNQKGLAVTLAAIGCFAGAGVLSAASTGYSVVYTASGTFAVEPVSGDDALKLGGETFQINITASPSAVPDKTGPNWDYFLPLPMKGVVHSSLVGRTTPVDIKSAHASIFQALGPEYDLFTATFPIAVVSVQVFVDAQLSLPPGTLTRPLIHPFTAVTLSPANATVTYTVNGTDTTVLAVEQGGVVANVSTTASVQLSPADRSDAGFEADAIVPRFKPYDPRNP